MNDDLLNLLNTIGHEYIKKADIYKYLSGKKDALDKYQGDMPCPISDKWQPIETAPRDKEILVWSEKFGSPFDTDAMEFGRKPVVPNIEWKIGQKWVYAYQAKFCDKSPDGQWVSYPRGFVFLEHPTYWKPLPEPPLTD